MDREGCESYPNGSQEGTVVRLAVVTPGQLAVVRGDALVLIGDALAGNNGMPSGATMIDLIERYGFLKDSLGRAVEAGPTVELDHNRLRPPIEKPSKVWAAATNYRRGSTGLGDASGRGTAGEFTPEEILEMAFLKPPSAIIGPEQEDSDPKERRDCLP
jgi:2-keto-4-pentenoate hydratase/2-oxohepta-3-ene-1,7-dioic acid hydratase in catechol pathway